MWPPGGVQPRHQVGGGVPRLGRRCPASARDLFGLGWKEVSHLNAWSSRKYVMVIPSGLMGISWLGTCDLKRKTKLAV
jgi:hypothetical protein